MLKRRISSTLAAIVAVILGVVVMPAVPTAGAVGEIPGNGDITIGIREMKFDSVSSTFVPKASGELHNFPSQYKIAAGPITDASFSPMSGRDNGQKYCYANASTGCLYLRIYVVGESDRNGQTVRYTVPVKELQWNADKSAVIVTPQATPDFPEQDNVNLFVPKDQTSTSIVAEFVSTAQFVAINYDKSEASALKELKGTGFQTATRQVVSRDTTSAKATLSLKFDRTNEIEFEQQDPGNMGLYYIANSTPDKDYSTVNTTIQVRDVQLTGLLQDTTELNVKVKTPAKTGTAMVSATLSGKPSGQGKCWDELDPVTWCDHKYYKRGWGEIREKSVSLDSPSQVAIPYFDEGPAGTAVFYTEFDSPWAGWVAGAFTYFVDHLKIGNQIVGVPYPQQYRNQSPYTTVASYKTWYERLRQSVIQGRQNPIVEYRFDSGENAGLHVRVFIENIRVAMDQYPLSRLDSAYQFDVSGDRLNSDPIGTDDVNTYSQLAYLLRTRYRIEINNAQTNPTNVDAHWESSANSWVYNRGSYGVRAGVESANTSLNSAPVGMQILAYASDDGSSPTGEQKWRNMCFDEGAECSINTYKWTWVKSNNSFKIRYRYENGYGPNSTLPISTWVNDTKTPLSDGGLITENGVQWRQRDIPISGQGSVSFKRKTYRYSSSEFPLSVGWAYSQGISIDAKPFNFSVTHKDGTGSGSDPLSGTNDLTDQNVRDNFVFSIDRGIPDIAENQAFYGYNLYACGGGACHPMVTQKVSTTCTANGMDDEANAFKNSTDAYGNKRILPVVYPGSTIDLNDWNVCWSNQNGVQAINEIRAVPAADSASSASLVPVVYRADIKTSVNGLDNSIRDFLFQGVPGIGAGYTEEWLNANKKRNIGGAEYDRVDNLSQLTINSLPEFTSTSSPASLWAYYSNQTASYTVTTKWKLNGEELTVKPPAGLSSTISLDGKVSAQDRALPVQIGTHTLTATVDWTNKPTQCSIDPLAVGKEGDTSDPVALEAAGNSIDIADGDKWILYVNLNCSQKIQLDLLNSKDLFHLPDLTKWAFQATGTDQTSPVALNYDSAKEIYGPGSITINPPADDQQVDPYTTKLTIDKVSNADNAKYQNLFRRGLWDCGNTASTAVNNQVETIQMKLGTDASCSAELHGAEVTLFEHFVAQPATNAATPDVGALADQPAITLAATSVGDSLGNLAAVPSNTDLYPTASVPAGAANVSAATTFVAPGESYTFELRDAAGFYKVRALRYTGTVANFADTDISIASKWEEITEPYIPTEDNRDIILLEVAQVRGPVVLPLTGGKAQDLFIFAGLAATALATALGALQWHRRRRVPITL